MEILTKDFKNGFVCVFQYAVKVVSYTVGNYMFKVNNRNTITRLITIVH